MWGIIINIMRNNIWKKIKLKINGIKYFIAHNDINIVLDYYKENNINEAICIYDWYENCSKLSPIMYAVKCDNIDLAIKMLMEFYNTIDLNIIYDNNEHYINYYGDYYLNRNLILMMIKTIQNNSDSDSDTKRKYFFDLLIRYEKNVKLDFILKDSSGNKHNIYNILARYGKTKLIEYIYLLNKVDLNDEKFKDCDSPAYTASLNSHYMTTKKLIDLGFSIENKKNKISALAMAYKNNDKLMIEYLKSINAKLY